MVVDTTSQAFKDSAGLNESVLAKAYFAAALESLLAGAATDITDRAARLLGHVTIDNTNVPVNIAQLAASAIVTSVAGILDVMPRKRDGVTGLSPKYSANHITTLTTTTPTAATAYVSTVVVNTVAAGTACTITIKTKEATPKILYSATLAIGAPVVLNFTEPILMTSGIDITTAGTAAGTADVFITYWQ